MTNGSSQGLFVVVAVVIFGIFIAISYTLFRDTLTPSLSSMFEDSTFEAEYALKEIDNINSLRTEGNLTYAKLKSSNTTDSDVYVALSKNSDGHFVIVTSSIKEGETSLFGKNIFGNDLIIPNHIDGIKIVAINESAFYNAKFKGQLILPKYLERIEKMAFFEANFSGRFVIPENVTYIGDNSLPYSKFSGYLKLNEGLKYLGNNSLFSSNFKGDLTLPSSLETLGILALKESRFGGTFTQKNKDTIIGRDALKSSVFKNYSFGGENLNDKRK